MDGGTQSVFQLCKNPRRWIQHWNWSSLVRNLNGRWYAVSLPTMLKPYKVYSALKPVFLGTRPKRTVVCNQSSNYAKPWKVNTALKPIFLGTEPKRKRVCNQSSIMLKLYNVNTALKSVFFGTKLKRTVACSQSSIYAKTLWGECSAEISFPWYEI